MKKLFLILGFSVLLYSRVFALTDEYEEALRFAKAYENELKIERQIEPEKSGAWKADVAINSGLAQYKEAEAGVRSDWKAFYAELMGGLTRETENDIEVVLNGSYGRTAVDTETWYVNGIKYQTNDMDFYRVNLKGSLGKILYFQRARELRFTPFIGYGFRFINFERTNFNILNTITSREVVTEKYYIHHFDVGLKFEHKINSKWGYSGVGAFGYVFYNEAENSALGSIQGSGGYLGEGNLNLHYSLNEYWQLMLGGSLEWQYLKGDRKGNIIWPDNKLNIYGGRIGLRYLF